MDGQKWVEIAVVDNNTVSICLDGRLSALERIVLKKCHQSARERERKNIEEKIAYDPFGKLSWRSITR